MKTKLHSADLLDGMRDMQEVGNCQVTIINATPSSWKVTIVSAGVKFFYRDGTDYIDGPRNINLSSGQSATFISDDPDACVFGELTAITVDVEGEGTQTFTDSYQVEEDDECLLHYSLTLGPAATAKADVLGKLNVKELQLISK